ncbi:MAG: hypothetical protein ACR2FR_08630 [Rubrobacter sp.]
MEGGREIRLEALRLLTNLAVNDDRFRHGLWNDLEGTLSEYGFDLSARELAQLRNLMRAVDDSVKDEVFGARTEQHR